MFQFNLKDCLFYIRFCQMDKAEVKQIALQMSTREDLLALLNRIKLEKIRELGLETNKFYPFTMKHLLYYCNPNNTFHRYRLFKIKKKSGGFREISAPRNQSFLMLLQVVNEILKAMYIPSDHAMGFAEGRSVVTNADVHKGQNYVFNIDLKDFFPSVEQGRVMKRLTLAPFNFLPQIALLISGLCSMRVKRDKPNEHKHHELDKHFKYVLPQGAPTSPIITNMICDTLDRRLNGLAKRFGLHYTRYADDITFSSMHNVYANKGEFRKELVRIIEGQGFAINDSKTRLQKIGGRQEVTGVIISQKLNVTKNYVREIRSLLHIWEKYGYSVAISKFLPKYKDEKGYVKKGNPDLINVLDGKLMYLKMVKSDTDSVYLKLNTKFQELIKRDSMPNKTNTVGITYIETIPVVEFEKINQTEVTIIKKNGKPRYGEFFLRDIKDEHGKSVVQWTSVSKKITEEDESNKENLVISNCRGVDGKQFWQIHYADKVTISTPKKVNIDELNNELDSLLII